LPRTASAELAAWVDEYGELDRLYDQFRPTARRRDEVRKLIEAQIVGPDDQTVTLVGSLYKIDASPREMKTSIRDMQRLFEALGPKRFVENCSFTIASLEKLSIDTSELVSKARTGSRTLEPILIQPARAPGNTRVGKLQKAAARAELDRVVAGRDSRKLAAKGEHK
jgi:hypothetical protein